MPTLLIVEDEFLIANDLRRMLEKAGYRVLGMAGSVPEAIGLLSEQTPDIVLLDIFLNGDQTGIDLAQWLSLQSIPFVFLSANLTDSVLEAAKVTEPFGFLNKPFREKDVLTTLEIARYRHAHSEEAKLRQQQTVQMAVNDAIVTIQNREQLCLAIADQINKLVPFSFLNLRIGLPDKASFYWLMLEKTVSNAFERVNITQLLRGEADENFLEKLDCEAPDQLWGEQGVFAGDAFEELCKLYITARSCRDNFGVRSLLLLPIQLKQNSITSIILTSTTEQGFALKDYQAVRLIAPQIALALNNLLAYEEIEDRRKTKATELTIVNVFQHGKEISRILLQVATVLNELIPFDLLGIYGLGRLLHSGSDNSIVQKQRGTFVPYSVEDSPSNIFKKVPGAEQTLIEGASWPPEPTLIVGEQFAGSQQQNRYVRDYAENLGLKSWMSVPIVIKGQMEVSLVLASTFSYAFTPKDLCALQEISVQLTLSLENLVAFERIKVLSEQLEREKSYLTEEIKTTHNFEEIVGSSPALQRLFNSVAQVAPTDYTVLVMGETGTGKELIARAIHNLSSRSERPIIKVNCAALPANLIESELFGHEKGAFTGAIEKRVGKFELANGGTIFLDEIGELPLELQPKLLRAIQEKEIERIGGQKTRLIDTRIIAATNRNLKQEVDLGRFRSDLYYRLNVFPIVVPPLRERPGDILPLTTYFLHRISKKLGKPLTGIAHASLKQILHYSWPGNIRELEHVLERAAILSPTATLELAESLQLPTHALPVNSNDSLPIMPIEETMRTAILAALRQSENRIRGHGGAAELLNLKPTTLEARMKKLNISTHS